MTIRSKLIIGNALISCFAIIIGIIGTATNHHTLEHHEIITNKIMPTKHAIEQIQKAGLGIVASTNELGFLNAERRHSDLDENYDYGSEYEAKQLRIDSEKLENAIDDFYLTSPNDVPHQKITTDITIASWQLFAFSEELVRRIKQGEKGQSLLEAIEEFETAEKHFMAVTDQALQIEQQRSGEQSAAINKEIEQNILRMTLISFATIVIAALYGYLMFRSITKPLSVLEWAANQLGQAAQPTKIEIHSRDEYGKVFNVFNQMVERINLLNKNLLSEKEVAEKASSAKSQFLATMSHEIRTPMNGVLGTLNMLKTTPLTSGQKRLLQAANSSGVLLLTVINDILDFSKIEAGKLELEITEFDLIDPVEETIALLAEPAQKKNLELINLIDPQLPRKVLGDPTRLKQVLNNLIGNAIKFTEQGEILVSVQRDDSGQAYLFSVSDTGIGMSAEQQQSIFLAFSQADNSTTRKYGGSGLGLAISHRLVEKMGGELRVHSTIGQGATFSFAIPLPAATDRLDKEQHHPQLASQRVLIVDDCAAARNMFQETMSHWGIKNITSASCGEEALQQLNSAEAPFDIAFIDMHMPGMSGCDLIKALKADRRYDALNIIMTGTPCGCENHSSIEGVLAKTSPRSTWLKTLLKLSGASPVIEENPMPTTDAPHFQQQRVLLVEDVAINQMVAEDALLNVGLQVDIAENGQEALDAVQNKHYAAILMDVQMPIMDGLEATRRIRQLGGDFTTLPIIAMTAHALEGDADISLNAGMNDHITKPLDQKTMLRVLDKWLNHADQNKATAQS